MEDITCIVLTAIIIAVGIVSLVCFVKLFITEYEFRQGVKACAPLLGMYVAIIIAYLIAIWYLDV